MIEGPWSDIDFRAVIGSTAIDFDWTKEEANRKKHGYSLLSAVHFLERWLLPIPSPLLLNTDPFEDSGEVRCKHMTLDDEKNVVFFVTTMRPDETVRVISLRRASDEERDLYIAHAKAHGYQLPVQRSGS